MQREKSSCSMGSSNSQVTQVLLKITINPNSAPCDVCRVHTLMLYTWLQLHMGGDIPSFIISPLSELPSSSMVYFLLLLVTFFCVYAFKCAPSCSARVLFFLPRGPITLTWQGQAKLWAWQSCIISGLIWRLLSVPRQTSVRNLTDAKKLSGIWLGVRTRVCGSVPPDSLI